MVHSKSPERRGAAHPKWCPLSSMGIRAVASSLWILHPKRSSFTLPTSHWTADTGGVGAGLPRSGRAVEETGVLALIASHTAKASSCSSRRISISMPGWRREGLYAKQSLWNITKWRETKAKLSQDIRVTYFFNCIPSVYCVYFIPGILLKEKNESFWDQLNVHNICLLLSFIPVYLM